MKTVKMNTLKPTDKIAFFSISDNEGNSEYLFFKINSIRDVQFLLDMANDMGERPFRRWYFNKEIKTFRDLLTLMENEWWEDAPRREDLDDPDFDWTPEEYAEYNFDDQLADYLNDAVVNDLT